MSTSEKTRTPKLKSFRFDYDPNARVRGQQRRVSVDDILDSMNRSIQVGQMLDYDPELESYYERQSGARKRGIGKITFLSIVGLGAVAAWLYGGTNRLLQTGWFADASLSMFGRMVPVWMIFATFVIFFFLFAAVSRARSIRAESVLNTY